MNEYKTIIFILITGLDTRLICGVGRGVYGTPISKQMFPSKEKVLLHLEETGNKNMEIGLMNTLYRIRTSSKIEKKVHEIWIV